MLPKNWCECKDRNNIDKLLWLHWDKIKHTLKPIILRYTKSLKNKIKKILKYHLRPIVIYLMQTSESNAKNCSQKKNKQNQH